MSAAAAARDVPPAVLSGASRSGQCIFASCQTSSAPRSHCDLRHRPSCRSEGGEEEDEEEEEEEAGEGGSADADASGPAISFWGVASALTATVKARTAEVLTAVHDTDWRAELEAFQQVGAGPPAGCHLHSSGAPALLRQRPELLPLLPATPSPLLTAPPACSPLYTPTSSHREPRRMQRQLGRELTL